MIDDKEIIDGLQKFIDKILNSESSEWKIMNYSNYEIYSDSLRCEMYIKKSDTTVILARFGMTLNNDTLSMFSNPGVSIANSLKMKYYDILRDLKKNETRNTLIKFLELENDDAEMRPESVGEGCYEKSI